MSRTHGQYQMDTPFTDGVDFFPASQMSTSFAAATDAVLTRNAAGQWSWNQIASKTNIYAINLNGLGFRLGTVPFMQQQFGGSVGPIDVQGAPPFSGASQLIPPTTNKFPKGVKVLDFVVDYVVATNPLTAMTCRYDRTVYAEGTAPTSTNILASAANGLLLTVNNAHSVKVTGLPTQSFEITDLSSLWFEISVQTPAGGTAQIHGIHVHYAFNYN